ncbi:hypothetical protein FQR65_LT19425 [Abscondita terminalis]|nr:hypothetical protein FQR65_LT19425 [Abscondita terminalis]
MREALNAFVIRGINSNIPFQAALLAHPRFRSGDFNTGFIAEHYAHGFQAEDVPHGDPDFLVALAGHMNRRYRARAATISGQMRGHELKVSADYCVVVLGADGQHQYRAVQVSDFDAESRASTVTVDGKPYTFRSETPMRAMCVQGSLQGYSEEDNANKTSTSEAFWKDQGKPQTERNAFLSESLMYAISVQILMFLNFNYSLACAKLYAYWIVINYREAYNMYACNGYC